MKRILLFLFALCFFFAEGQIKLNQMEPFIKNGVRQDSGLILTNSLGVQTYVHFDSIFSTFMIDCDKVENCLDSGTFFCDKVQECLDDESVLCAVLNTFPLADVEDDGVFVWINAEGECQRGPISSLPGFGFNCDSVLNCLESGILCEALNELDTATISINSKVLFFDGEGNCYRGDISDLPGVGWNCDSVLLCLEDGVLCEAIGGFTMGVPEDGDYAVVWNAEGCKLVALDSLGGGMDSLNCDAVLECLTGGTLCAALDSLPESDAMSGFQLIGIENGDCKKFNWDSLMTDCQFELEVGNFGSGPENCSFATTCDGGNTYSNQFWNTLELDGSTLKLNGNATGQSCLMSEVTLNFMDSLWVDTTACPTIYYSKGGNTYSYQLPRIRVSIERNIIGGIYDVSVGYSGGCGESDNICVCDLGSECSGALTGVCGNEGPPMLMKDKKFSLPIPSATLTNVYEAGIPEYKSRRKAKKDPELKPGAVYIVEGSGRIYFKR
jgi:hypothetical protein